MCSRLWAPLQHPSLLLGISRRPQILSLESVGSEIPAFSTAVLLCRERGLLGQCCPCPPWRGDAGRSREWPVTD